MTRCVFCGESIQPALLCRYCGRPQLVDCAAIVQLGQRCHLGYTSQAWGIWPATGGEAAHLWATESEARAYFAQWDCPPPKATNRSTWIALGVVFAILAVIYFMYHNYRYGNCYVQPGLFSWPNRCL